MSNAPSFVNAVRQQWVLLTAWFSVALLGLACVPAAPIPAEKLTGKDSAGATVEIMKQGNELVRARVIDSTLGVGEAEIATEDNDGIAFTVHFPAGATITYTGKRVPPADQGVELIEGTWIQQRAGLFGADSGAWSIPG